MSIYSVDNKVSQGEVYWAADEANKVASEALTRASSFYNVLSQNYYLDQLVRNWLYYHGQYNATIAGDSHRVSFTGEEGELSSLAINHFRNIGQHMLNMITANRPTMEARAVNTDYKSLAQTYLANGILDYYMREKSLEDCIRRATEMAVVLGSGFIRLEWNATAGELYDFDPETGEREHWFHGVDKENPRIEIVIYRYKHLYEDYCEDKEKKEAAKEERKKTQTIKKCRKLVMIIVVNFEVNEDFSKTPLVEHLRQTLLLE